jgi:hypothetical protein
MIKEGKYGKMWNEMASCIKRVAKEILGKSKECGRPTMETWWWNEDVQAAIRLKRELYKPQNQ